MFPPSFPLLPLARPAPASTEGSAGPGHGAERVALAPGRAGGLLPRCRTGDGARPPASLSRMCSSGNSRPRAPFLCSSEMKDPPHSLQRGTSSPSELIPQKQNSIKTSCNSPCHRQKNWGLITKTKIAVVLTSRRSNRNQTSISEQLAINCQQLKSKPGAHKGSV